MTYESHVLGIGVHIDNVRDRAENGRSGIGVISISYKASWKRIGVGIGIALDQGMPCREKTERSMQKNIT